jgi:hypothetical protein
MGVKLVLRRSGRRRVAWRSLVERPNISDARVKNNHVNNKKIGRLAA